MATFQFTPSGIEAVNAQSSTVSSDDFTPGGALIAQLQALSGATGAQSQLPLPNVAQPVARSAKADPAALDGLGPRGVLKAARARIKALRAELKRHEQLKAELAELQRLVAAAKTTPTTAPVRRIASAR